jgi:uncharacterized protein involved in outer membrane biogenesis
MVIVNRRKILFISGGIALLCVTVLVAVACFIGSMISKSDIEAALSYALEMDVVVNGKMRIVLLPVSSVSLQDVRLRNRGEEIATAQKVEIELAFMPLLNREMQITGLHIVTPRFFFTRERDGTFNFERREREPTPKFLTLITIKKFSISKGYLSFTDTMSQQNAEIKEFNTVLNIYISQGDAELLRRISLTGNCVAKNVTLKKFTFPQIKLAIEGGKGIFDLDPVTFTLFGGNGQAAIKMDVIGETPLFAAHTTISRFNVEESVEAFSQKKIMKGGMDLIANLRLKGKSVRELKKSIGGDLSLKGENLTLLNVDLDSLLSKYERSQNFNLLDVGAFALLGPLGSGLTRGYELAGVYEVSRGGTGTVDRLVSVWKVKGGIAEAKDVALTTKRNRMALKGRLDFVNGQFDNVTIAALDEKGCAKFSEKLRGPFGNPSVDKVSPARSLVGPVINVFEKTVKLLKGGKCKVFYSGSLKHPK